MERPLDSGNLTYSSTARRCLTNFDIFAAPGGMNTAVIREQYAVTPTAGGQISVTYSNGAVDQAKSVGSRLSYQHPARRGGDGESAGSGRLTLNWAPVPWSRQLRHQASTEHRWALHELGDQRDYGDQLYRYRFGERDDLLLRGLSSRGRLRRRHHLRRGERDDNRRGSTFAAWQTQYFQSPTNPLAAANVDADGTARTMSSSTSPVLIRRIRPRYSF